MYTVYGIRIIRPKSGVYDHPYLLLHLVSVQVARLVVEEVRLGVVDPLLGAVGEPDGVRVDVPLQLIVPRIPAVWRRPGKWKSMVLV